MNQKFPSTSRIRRIIAFFIDYFVICFLILIPFFLLIDFETFSVSDIYCLIIIFVVVFSAKDCFLGISLGKWIMGIRVGDQNDPDQTPSFLRLYIRNLFVIIFPVECVVLALNSRKRRIGDIFCNTVVVPNPQKATKSYRILILVGVFILLCVLGTYSGGVVMKNSEAYKTAEQEIIKDEAIISRIGEVQGFGFLPQGNISITNGYGNASFLMRVKGANENLRVRAILEKQPASNWEMIELNY